MKKRYVIIGLLAASLSTFGQRGKGAYSKKQLSSTDMQVLFSYYTQDNNHSPVTGGIGTEELQVYSLQTSFDHRRDSVNTFHFSAGVDMISSASTDNIDFVRSSASIRDFRGYFKAGYDRRIKESGFTAGVNTSGSIESDYRSLGVGGTVQYINPSRTRNVSASVHVYMDDLNWHDDGKWDILVYPFELRHVKWFDIHKRKSYNVMLNFYQTINRRMAVGFFPGVIYQEGLLSTPFHRVYFSDEDNTRRVENLPRHRLKIPVGVQLNTFLGNKFILRTYYRFYWDDFGIQGHTADIELPVKASPIVTITPFVRMYTQEGSEFFKPYRMHELSQEFYTSDYDLSGFTSYKTGFGLRYAPFKVSDRSTFKAMEFRYAVYKRSDGLLAHMVSTFFDFNFAGKNKDVK